MINERIDTKRMAVQTSRVGSLAVDALFCILRLVHHPEVYKALMNNPQQFVNITGLAIACRIFPQIMIGVGY